MAFANFNTKEIHCKIIYFGAEGSGKTTNLQHLLKTTSPSVKADKLALEPPPSQPPSWFEFLPISIGELHEYHLTAHLYTMPQDHLYSTFLSVLLKGIDGFVFVADSRLEQLPHNLAAWEYTKSLLTQVDEVVAKIPAVIQYNQRDTPSALPLNILKPAINTLDLPEIEASANQGVGIMESLHIVVEQLARQLNHQSI